MSIFGIYGAFLQKNCASNENPAIASSNLNNFVNILRFNILEAGFSLLAQFFCKKAPQIPKIDILADLGIYSHKYLTVNC